MNARSQRLNTDKLSAAVRQAVEDMDRHSAEGWRYAGASRDWYAPLTDGTCAVCLVGATFTRFGAQTWEHLTPEELIDTQRISAAEWHMLNAIDALQHGEIHTALWIIDTPQARKARVGTTLEWEAKHGLAQIARKDPEWDQETRGYYTWLAERLKAAGV